MFLLRIDRLSFGEETLYSNAKILNTEKLLL